MQNSDSLNEVLYRTDIDKVAQKLGITISRRDPQYTTALCPFHADKTPSLALYREPGNPHYYCFACGARGGILDLVEKQRRQSRRESLVWLAEEVGVDLPESLRRGRESIADLGSATFTQWLRDHHKAELLQVFAERRRLDPKFLVGANAFAVDMRELKVESLTAGERAAMERAGVLAARRDKLAAVANGNQIVFALGGDRGFIFRALDEAPQREKTQRYRFSRGLRKSEILFGSSAVSRQLVAGQPVEGIFVVEGLMDALRLQSLGFAAVAILGTSLSRRQSELLQDLCNPDNRPVCPLHLFLDADEAGRRAAPAAIRTLMGVEEPMPMDVIHPEQDGDPDDLLAGQTPETAREHLASWAHSVLAVLAHHYSGFPLPTVLADLPAARPLLRVETLRYIAAQLAGNWSQVRDLADPAAIYIGDGARSEGGWLRESLDRASGLRPSAGSQPETIYQPVTETTDEAEVYLRRALRIAQSSNFRREYPFDWGGMTRLALAANAASIAAVALLAEPDRRPIPYPARFVPKDDGRTRLKAGPWPEDALNQQYVMSELLRVRPDTPGWYLEFPSVRLIRSTGVNPIVTGPDWLRPVGRPGEPSPVVSFAYQIDQEIVEGDAPPRREGMFVPYRECWQQFIDHLDGFVARQPLSTDTFYAVRLDISGFFDNLPRYAVDSVLQKSISEAVERHFTGRDFADEVAKLLQPQREPASDANNQKRAELVARWLSDQSFGYRYFEPSSGTLTEISNHSVGIPQGPDLSAFLANLALYPLDRAATDAIEADRISRETNQPAHEAAVYGRYVDDMVIVSTSQSLLSRIEAIIGQELRDRGLSMNAKHERTKALDRRKIREWLLGERGAAVLVSASGEETPTTSRASVDELLNVGPETPRSQVLQLLHSDDLYSPRWSQQAEMSAKVDATLQRLRSLPSVKLRYYDWVSAARWVIHSLANQLQEELIDEFVSRLLGRWREIYGEEVATEIFGELPRERAARQQYLALTPAMLLFDALERSIDSRHDRRGQIDSETRHALKIGRERLTRLVYEDDLPGVLLQRLRDAPEIGSAFHRIDGMMRIQHLGIRGLANASLKPTKRAARVNFASQGSYAERRFALNGIGKAIRSYAEPILLSMHERPGDTRSPESEPLLGLHEALARLMADGESEPQDPLAPISDVVGGWMKNLALVDAPASLQNLNPTKTIIDLIAQFLISPSTVSQTVDPSKVLRAFVEIVAGVPDGHELLAARKHLVSELTNGQFSPIAVPPGIDASAFFARHGSSLKAFAFTSNGQSQDEGVPLFGVEATRTEHSNGLTELDCRYPPTHMISDPREPKVDPRSVRASDLREFAKAYRDLSEAQIQDGNATEGAPGVRHALTPLHLLQPAEDGAKWMPFGASARLPIGPQAFVRLYEGRLHSIGVRANGAHLWQVGFALADNLGYRGFARSSELDRLTVATLEPNDDAASIPFYVMQLAIPRLCGAYLGRSRFTIDPAKGLPVAIEQQLARLEAIEDDDSSAASNLAHLLEAGAEVRAAELLRDAPAPLQVAGALSSVFRSLGRAAARPERIFTQNLPRPKENERTHRRTVDLWLAAASRIERLANAEMTIGLRSTAAAIRVLAVAKLAQALTLEVWALLSDADRQQLAYFAPNLADLDLTEEALLISGTRVQRSAPVADQAVRLIGALRTHAVPGATARAALDHITPLGWVVALATITGLVELNELASQADQTPPRPELLVARKKSGPAMQKTQTALDRLWDLLAGTVKYLSSGTAEDRADDVHSENWPWCAFKDLVTASEQAVLWMTEASHIVGELYELLPATHSSRFFQIADPDERGYCLIHREGGRQNLPGWQIDRDSLGITRPGDLETRENAFGEHQFVWSETIHKGRLVSLSVGYRSLAELAGTGVQNDERSSPTGAERKSDRIEREELTSTEEPSSSRQSGSSAPENAAPAQATLTASSETRSSVRPNSTSGGGAIREFTTQWHALRQGEEAKRANAPRSVAIRIAMLQMNFQQIGCSFYHPICEVSGSKFTDWENNLAKLRQNGTKNKEKTSIFEAWRRKILIEALERCNTLKVELLILPEYATRPDTIAWLAENLEYLAPKTSVLAGTFRHAARAQQLHYASGTARPLSLGAVVPLVVPSAAFGRDEQRRRNSVIYSRLKKYPATGMSEFMRPEREPLRAVYGEEPVPESLRYVRDLICSEVFVTMAPANIYSSVPALLSLHHRLGVPVAHEEVLNGVFKDIELIAKDTSPAIRRDLADPRKTIIAVPAATTRPSDHHIFGEAGAKAAGLTTIFANMAGKRGGESCFIGHYKSERIEGSHVWNLQSPYHGRAPGIWSYLYDGGKPLGEHETALVVADVNPIDTNVSKPARQVESFPISLVAHIPFFLEDGPKAAKIAENAEAFARKALALVKTVPGGASASGLSSCELDLDGAATVRSLAAELASVDASCRDSLEFRAEGTQVITMQPHVHPAMPILTDWAFVPKPTENPLIEVPDIDAIDLESTVSLQ